MANMIQKAKQQVTELVTEAYLAAAEKGELPAGLTLNGSVEIPGDTANGDYAANYAMASAKAYAHAPPRKGRETLIANMKLDGSWFESVDVAGPGFMNFRMGSKWYSDVLKNVAEEGDSFCNCNIGEGKKAHGRVRVPNPTGPMHMGMRAAACWEMRLHPSSRAGYDVWREFYVNDSGNQIEKFAKQHRGAQHPASQGRGRDRVPRGRLSTATISRSLQSSSAKSMATTGSSSDTPERHKMMAEFGLSINLPKMKRDLARYGIEYDQWFLESSLHASGYVADSGAEAHRRRLYI